MTTSRIDKPFFGHRYRGRFRSRQLEQHYRAYLIAQLISGQGSLMAAISVIYVTLQITRQTTAWVSVAEAAEYIPILVFARLAGRLVERYSRRDVLLVTQAAQVVTTTALGVLFCLGHLELWPIVGYAVILGILQPANIAARQLFFSDLLGPDGFQKGIASYNALLGIGRMVAPVACGLMIEYLGAGWVFIANGISFFGVIAVLAMIDPAILAAAQRERGNSYNRAPESFGQVLKVVMPVIIIVVLVGSLGYQFVTTNSLMVHGVFHAGASSYGLLGGFLAAGMVIGSWWARKRQTRSIGIVCGSAVILGIVEAATLAIGSIYEYMPLLFVAGLCVAVFTVSAMDLMQRWVNTESRGTALTVYNAAYIGLVPAGTLFIGWCGHVFGTRMSVGLPGLIVAFCSLITVAAFSRRIEQTRITQIPHQAQPAERGK